MSADQAVLTADEKVRLRIAAFGIPEPQSHDEHLLEVVEEILNRLAVERDEARATAEAAEENRISLANQLTRNRAAFVGAEAELARLKATMERLADKIGATPDRSMSHRNVATSIRTALSEED